MPDSVQIGANVFLQQGHALLKQAESLSGDFEQAVQLIADTQGKLVVCGMGKSGIIGRKIAATLASTGSPSFFVHPAEAFHGDLGMITAQDSVLLLSYSGETEEIRRLLPHLQQLGAPVIAITAVAVSTLATVADLTLHVDVPRECCPNNLAPTTSTTMMLVMGDALAMALMTKRAFQPEDFARRHPGGSLGKKLLTRVGDVMHRHPPCCSLSAPFRTIVNVMTHGQLGLTLVVGETQETLGIITDGDLRRAMEQHEALGQLQAHQLMTPAPLTIPQDAPLSAAQEKMASHQVTALVAINPQHMATGVIRLLDLCA